MSKARNISKKRDAILAKIQSTTTHPSAEWVYRELKGDFPDLSLGTVYRNIALFKEEGQIISVGTVSGQERFDADTTPHAHLICIRCARVVDVDVQFGGNATYKEIGEKYGFSVRTHDLSFKGLCNQCLEATEAFDN